MLRLRPATLTDVPAIVQIHLDAWRAAYRGLMPDAVLGGLSEEAFEASWRHRLVQAPRSTMLATAGGDPVGFAVGGPSRDPDAAPLRTGELYGLYVAPDRWGSGVGRALWKGMRGWLLVEEFAEVTLWVLEANRRARRFYERAGFVLEPGARKVVDREGAAVPEVRYRLALD